MINTRSWAQQRFFLQQILGFFIIIIILERTTNPN